MKRLSRRRLLQGSLGGALLAASGGSLWRPRKVPEIPVRVNGPSAALGHKLREGFAFPAPTETRKTKVLILGGGIAGLSAAWRLQKKGCRDFQVLELESEVGGNSRSGINSISAYPWGAHYVPTLNEDAHEARELFEDLGIITGHEGGRPIYNEYFLCQAPHERLFIYQRWQEGLLPKLGTSAEEQRHASEFFSHVESLRLARGADGRPAFTIPLALSSADPSFRDLDAQTMARYMADHGWTSPALNWYVNYCCRDDFGTPHSTTSAWAGLHYFCSRRPFYAGEGGSGMLTWPEGNGWIVHRLEERLGGRIVRDAMAFHVEERDGEVHVDVWHPSLSRTIRWTASSLILALPRFVASRLGPELARVQRPRSQTLSYAPWMVANITLTAPPPANGGAPIAWDNVFFTGRSLGYVVATHQRAAIETGATVWTYYRPLDHCEPAEARREAERTSPEEWRRTVLADLFLAHPDLASLVKSIDVWIWGHAMARPVPGFIWGEERVALGESQGRVVFAHSDMSGLSIFEEANFHGVRAADAVLERG